MAITFFPTNPVAAQSIAAYNAGLTQQDIARVQAAVEEEKARQAAETNRAQQYFQAQQLAQANANAAAERDLQRQQLASADYFNRGRLTNEEKRIAADAELAKAQMEGNAALRREAIQPKVDELNAKKAVEAQAQSELLDAVTNHASLLNARDALQNQLGELDKAKQSLSDIGEPGMVSKGIDYLGAVVPSLSRYVGGRVAARNAAFAQLPYQAQVNPGAEMKQNVAAVDAQRSALQSNLTELNAMLAAGEKMGLQQHVGKPNPSGPWVPTLKIQAMPTASTTTGAAPAPGYLNVLRGTVPTTMTNAPVSAVAAPVTRGKITPDVALQYLQRTNGDKNAARQLAVADGWEL